MDLLEEVHCARSVSNSVCFPLPLNHVQDFVGHQAEEEGVILPAVASVLSAVSCYLR